MKQQEIFKKIGIIINELNEQYDYLASNKDGLNNLELELFVANAHFLAEHAEVLQKLNAQNSILPIPPAVVEEKHFEPIVQQVSPVVEVQHIDTIENNIVDDSTISTTEVEASAADIAYIEEESEIIRHELSLDDIPNWDEDENEHEEIPLHEKETVATPHPATPVIIPTVTDEKIEVISDEPLTINQKISAQLNNSSTRVTEQLTAQPISDLKAAITLNDKLLYIKDLFNGYNLAYSEVIELLNRFTTFEEADKFLQSSYAVKNSWETKQVTVDKFYDLLKRRYA